VINTDSQGNIRLESEPELLWEAVRLAHTLVSQIKSEHSRSSLQAYL